MQRRSPAGSRPSCASGRPHQGRRRRFRSTSAQEPRGRTREQTATARACSGAPGRQAARTGRRRRQHQPGCDARRPRGGQPDSYQAAVRHATHDGPSACPPRPSRRAPGPPGDRISGAPLPFDSRAESRASENVTTRKCPASARTAGRIHCQRPWMPGISTSGGPFPTTIIDLAATSDADLRVLHSAVLPSTLHRSDSIMCHADCRHPPRQRRRSEAANSRTSRVRRLTFRSPRRSTRAYEDALVASGCQLHRIAAEPESS